MYFYYFHDIRYLLSFPTRRSSDLEKFRIWYLGSRLRSTPNAAFLLRQPRIENLSKNSSSCGSAETDSTCACRVRLCGDRKSTRLNSSHVSISYAVFCLKKKKRKRQ